jgi:gamma-glutamyl phosphate reductase
VHRRIRTKKEELGALQASLPARESCSQVARPVVVVQNTNGQATSATAVAQAQQQQLVNQCVANPNYDRIRLQLEQKQVEVRDAERDLEQLDRQASQDAVPREWRRGW